jgi:hypothetical protein
LNGNCLSYSCINLILQSHRKNKNSAVVQQAHEEYGSQFNKVFSYVKNSRVVVMMSVADIVKRYNELQDTLAV